MDSEMPWTQVREILVFVGLMFQAAAVFWVWRDWSMSQYTRNDWTRTHRQDEARAVQRLREIWEGFGGGNESVDWDEIDSDALEDMRKMFPAHGDDETLRARKLEAIGSRFGVGPSDAELIKIGSILGELAILRRGVGNYRTYLRKKTFGTSLFMLAVGFTLQAIGSWPTAWMR